MRLENLVRSEPFGANAMPDCRWSTVDNIINESSLQTKKNPSLVLRYRQSFEISE